MKDLRAIIGIACLFTVFTVVRGEESTAQVKDTIVIRLIDKAEKDVQNGDFQSASSLYNELSYYNDSTQNLLSRNKIKILKDSQQIQEIKN